MDAIFDAMTENKRPRIRDVAKLAGVSEATVSVVLNNRVGENVRVSESTQQKIWDAVRELGYVANPVAQRLAGGQNHIIAVFTFESMFPVDASSFYYPFLIGIEQEADRQGYDLLLITGSTDPDSGKRCIYKGNSNQLSRADGAILLGHGDKKEVYRLLDEGFPFVYVGKRDAPNDDISYVAADYVSVTEQIVHNLFEHGHEKIAYISSPRQYEASIDRLRGFQSACAAHHSGRDGQIWSGEMSDFTTDVMWDYLDEGVSAFVAEDDTLGLRLLEMAGKMSLECPQDFSLAVLGNPLNPMQGLPDWTSFSIPRREMGSEALRMLVQLLTTPDEELSLPLRKLLHCTFVPGTTTSFRR
jgi:DNA-binding LacI/PurR family transcriptional regulator